MFDRAPHSPPPEPAALAHAVHARLPAFTDVAWLPDTGSTNADLLARAREHSPPKPWLLGTHQQHQGRGRAGRTWVNAPGNCLMFSCAFDVHAPPGQLPSLSPLSGIAACEALRTLAGVGGDDLRMKWPNDVQWRGAKLAGILVETVRNRGGTDAGFTVVMGIGINMRDSAKMSSHLERDVCDWSDIIGKPATAQAMIAIVSSIARAWHDALQIFERDHFDAFLRRFDHIDALAGQPVNVLDQGAVKLSGVAAGCDALGRLMLRTDSGLLPVSVGDISVRLSS